MAWGLSNIQSEPITKASAKGKENRNMRKAFINTLIKLSETDKDIYLLTADMGFGLVEQFATKFPKRFINVGVAEQNMIGVATGLALEGKKVFCYSIANFPTMRCLEQIRNDVCYHNLPVCIVNGGAGLRYGELGMSHHSVEDIAIMRCLPNMAVVSPYSTNDMVESVKNIYGNSKPCYLRMSRTANSPIAEEEQITIAGTTNGRVLTLATGGRMVEIAVEASRELIRRRIEANAMSVTLIKPFWGGILTEFVPNPDIIITIEEHSKIGGLGSAVAEVLAGMREHPPLVRMGTADNYLMTAMSYEELLVANHLTVEDIVKEALHALS